MVDEPGIRRVRSSVFRYNYSAITDPSLVFRTRSDQDLSSDTDNQANKKSSSGDQLGVLGISPGNINNLVEKFERQASPLSRVDSKSPSGRSSSGRDLKSPGFVQVVSRDLKSPNLVQDAVRKSPTRNTTVSRVFPSTTGNGNDDKNSTTSPESGQEDQVSESKQSETENNGCKKSSKKSSSNKKESKTNKERRRHSGCEACNSDRETKKSKKRTKEKKKKVSVLKFSLHFFFLKFNFTTFLKIYLIRSPFTVTMNQKGIKRKIRILFPMSKLSTTKMTKKFQVRVKYPSRDLPG